MSHISKVKVYVRDLAVFAEACRELGVQLVEGQKTFKTYNGKLGECDHAVVVPAKSRAYEIGLVRGRVAESGGFVADREGDCFELNFDEWGGGNGMVNRVGYGCGELLQAYSGKKIEATAKKNNYELTKTKNADGSWRYEATKRVASAFAGKTY